MRLAETATNKKGSSTRQLEKVMEELKEREQKRVLEARMNKEEALKLKATRILRFGRFAIRVPFTNTTRYRDQPLPESSAQPVGLKSRNENYNSTIYSAMTVTHYIPGQKHYGVMIPELNSKIQEKRVTKFSQEQKQIRIGNEQNFQIIEREFENDLSLSSTFSTELSPSKFGSKKTHSQYLVEAKETAEKTGEGFEVIPLEIFSDNSNVEALIATVKLKPDRDDRRCDQQEITRGKKVERTGPD